MTRRATSVVAAFDLSPRFTGFVALAGNEVLAAKVLKSPKELIGLRRICWVRDEVIHQLDQLSLQPIAVVVEDFAFSQVNRAHEMGGLGYVVRMALLEAGYAVLVAPVATNKKFCTGKGNARKSVMIQQCYKRWGFETDNDNVADGYSLTRCGQAYFSLDDTQRVRMVKDKLREETL